MKTRKKAKKGPILITFFILILLVFGSLYIFNEYFRKDNPNEKPTELDKEEDEELVYSNTFTFAGNVLINSHMWYDATDSDGKYNFEYIFKDLKENMKKTNINFYSQQSIIGGKELGLSSYSIYNSPDEVGKSMIDLGFNMVSLANYHAYDKGLKGIEHSTNFWEENKVVYSGTSSNKDDRLKNNVVTKNGITYGLLSYTTGTDTKFTDNYLVNVYDEELVKSDVEVLKKSADIIIVSIDWSNIKEFEVTAKQKEIAKYIKDLGVDIIIGNNGYSVLPIEVSDNTLICYSLGNLLSGHTFIDSRISAVVDFELVLTKTDDNKKVEFKNINVLLTYSYNKNNTSFKVMPFTTIEKELPTYKTYYEKYEKVLKSLNDNITLYKLGETDGD